MNNFVIIKLKIHQVSDTNYFVQFKNASNTSIFRFMVYFNRYRLLNRYLHTSCVNSKKIILDQFSFGNCIKKLNLGIELFQKPENSH